MTTLLVDWIVRFILCVVERTGRDLSVQVVKFKKLVHRYLNSLPNSVIFLPKCCILS